jgi:hypothetical protein
MTIYKFTQLTVPPTLEKRLEVLAAFRSLVSQDDELVRQRRAEIAALRREAEVLRRCIDAFCRQLPELRAEIMKELKAQKYSPDQPRVPAGNPHGGEWTREGDSGSTDGSSPDVMTPEPGRQQRDHQYPQADIGTRNDGLVLAADDGIVKPHGMIVAPGAASLDPQGLNGPLLADEQQKIADTLSLIFSGNVSALGGTHLRESSA